MAAVIHACQALNRGRICKYRLNPLEMLDEHEILIKYRFPSWAIRQITDLLAADIAHKWQIWGCTTNNSSVPDFEIPRRWIFSRFCRRAFWFASNNRYAQIGPK